MDYKIILGSVAVVIAIISYIPYFRDIFSGKTKPHAFSWFVWGIITAIAFSAQTVEQGGAGAWTTGFTAVACFAISFLAFYKGNKDFPLFDWICLAAAGIALFLWWLTKNPVGTVLLITLTDAVAYLPTFRKSYFRPFQETLSTYVLSAVKFTLGIIALASFTFTTWFFPLAITFMNLVFITMVLVRRKQLSKTI